MGNALFCRCINASRTNTTPRKYYSIPLSVRIIPFSSYITPRRFYIIPSGFLFLLLKGYISILREVNSIPKGSVSVLLGSMPPSKKFLVTFLRGDTGARRCEIIVRRGNTIVKRFDKGPLKVRCRRPERGDNTKKS